MLRRLKQLLGIKPNWDKERRRARKARRREVKRLDKLDQDQIVYLSAVDTLDDPLSDGLGCDGEHHAPEDGS